MTSESLAYYIGLAIINFVAFGFNLLLVLMFILYRRKLLTDFNLNNKILLAISAGQLSVGFCGTLNWTLLATRSGAWIYKLLGTIPMFASMLATILILCILTFNQLIASQYPLRYNALVTPQRVYWCLAITLVITVLFAVSQMIVYKTYGSIFELRARSVFLTSVFALGVATLSISNYKLYRAIQHQRQRLLPFNSNLQKSNNPNSPSLNMATRPSTRSSFPSRSSFAPTGTISGNSKYRTRQHQLKKGTMCIWMVVIFVITWLPITAYYFSAFLGRDKSNIRVRRICVTCANFNAILNPCVYLLKRKVFRDILKHMLRIKPLVRDDMIWFIFI